MKGRLMEEFDPILVDEATSAVDRMSTDLAMLCGIDLELLRAIDGFVPNFEILSDQADILFKRLVEKD